MIILLSIIYLIPFFILSLFFSGQFLILFFGYFLNLIVLISQNSNSSEQAFNYFMIDNFVRAIAGILVIVLTNSFKNFSLKSLRLKENFLISLKKYAFNKKLILILIYIQLTFIGYVFIVSPDLSILSFNRNATISITIPSIRYVYPFFTALSPSLLASSLLSLITFKKIRLSILHLTLSLISLINIYLIGQRGYILMTLFVAFLSSFIFGIQSLIKGKLYISDIRKWLFILIIFPIIYNLRTLYSIGENKLFSLQIGDLKPLKAWDGAINAAKYLNTDIPPLINNIFNFLNHQSRINLGLQNSSDIVNTFLFSDFYYEKGFGYNITIPMDLHVSFKDEKLWIPLLLIYYTFLLLRYIKSTKFFLFTKNSLPGYFLITCSFSSILTGLSGWPLALIFYLQSHLFLLIENKKISHLYEVSTKIFKKP